MKKLIILLFVLGLSISLFAQVTVKQVVGKWKYTVETPDGNMTGVFKFVETDAKLAGEVITDDGYTLPFSKIEIQADDKLYLEVKTENDLIKVTVKIEGENFAGTGTSYNGDAPIKGEKVE